MANLRNLKKDIDYLATEAISDCWAFMYLYPDKKQEDCNSIINDIVDLRNSLFDRANHPDKENIRKHYAELKKDMLEKMDGLFIRISELNK